MTVALGEAEVDPATAYTVSLSPELLTLFRGSAVEDVRPDPEPDQDAPATGAEPGGLVRERSPADGRAAPSWPADAPEPCQISLRRDGLRPLKVLAWPIWRAESRVDLGALGQAALLLRVWLNVTADSDLCNADLTLAAEVRLDEAQGWSGYVAGGVNAQTGAADLLGQMRPDLLLPASAPCAARDDLTHAYRDLISRLAPDFPAISPRKDPTP